MSNMTIHKMIVQLEAENDNLFKDVIPIFGAFHQQVSYTYWSSAALEKSVVLFVSIKLSNHTKYE